MSLLLLLTRAWVGLQPRVVIAAMVTQVASPITSNAFTPAVGQLITVETEATGSATVNTGASITDSLATHLTWTQIGQIGGGNTTGCKQVWWAWAPASPVPMTVTVTYPSSPSICNVTVYGEMGADPITPIVGAQTAVDVGGTSITATTTVAPTAADNLNATVMTRNLNSAIVSGAAFPTGITGSEHHSVSPSATSLSETKSGLTSGVADFASTGATWTGMVAWVTKAVATAAPPQFAWGISL